MGWILGIKGTGDWHNSGVCLLHSDSDEIAFSSEEERFNNQKKTSAYPVASLAYALDYVGITADDIEHVASPASTREFFDAVVMGFYFPLVERYPAGIGALKIALETFKGLHRLEQFLGSEFPRAVIHMLDHHLCHVTSAHFCSPFEESASLTVDGRGEWATTTFSRVAGSRVDTLKRVGFPSSLGLLYTYTARVLGFGGPNPEGKVMGLASYGEPRFIDLFRDVLVVTGKMEFALSPEYYSLGPDGFILMKQEFRSALGLPSGEEGEFTQLHMDVAASLQMRLEEVTIQMALDLHEATGCKYLSLSGGVALNSVMNKKLVDQTPYDGVFIQPASDDGGTSLGAALAIKHLVLSSPRPTVWRGPYLGATHTRDEIRSLLDERGITYEEPDDLLGDVAGHIAEGRIIGWFQGAAELGPRALGNRSILCDPRPAEMKDILNQRVKHREWFRPYAPSVLAERSQDYFDLDRGSPYMLLVADVKPERQAEVAGITHVDGTARVQTVTRLENPLYYDLIKRFDGITSVPMLLNTSFNVRGEAIVNSPLDALECFLFTGLDYLILGDYLISKSENAAHYLDLAYDEYRLRRRTRHSEAFGPALARAQRAMA